MKKTCLMLSLLASFSVVADEILEEKCNQILVNTITTPKTGVTQVFFTQKGSSERSQGIDLVGWEKEKKALILSQLMAAKVSQVPVNIRTEGEHNCSIMSQSSTLKTVSF